MPGDFLHIFQVKWICTVPLTFCFHGMLSVMRDPGAGLCPGECHAAPASGGCVLPPLSPAASPPVTAHRIGKRVENYGRRQHICMTAYVIYHYVM